MKVNDAPANLQAEVRAKQNARADALRAALTPPELPFDAPPAPLPDEPSAGEPVDYHSHPALSASDVQAGYHTPENALWRRLNPSEPSPYMANGTAIHLAVLEPARFASEVVAKPDGLSFVTKEGKAWREANADRIIVSADMHARCCTYARFGKSALAQIAKADWTYERPLFWTDPIAGPCRMKPDAFAIVDDVPVNVSLKTTARTMTPAEWAVTMASTDKAPGYDIREAHYARGFAALYLGDAERWREVRTVHIIVSTDGIPQLVIAPMPEAVAERGHALWLAVAPRVTKAVQSNPPELLSAMWETYEAPRWATTTPAHLTTEEA
jgi:hypothetical protein